MAKARTYYTLLSFGPDDSSWAIEFGDYSRPIVRQEQDDMKDGSLCDHRFKIIKTTDGQREINAAVAALNAKVSS